MTGLREVIILCGGLGTRLQAVNPGLPKALVDVAGKPFLHYIIQYLQRQGLSRFVFALGHRHEMIEDYLQSNFPGIDAVISVEAEPLGTGGAVQLAAKKATAKDVLVVNGDTLFDVDIKALYQFHLQKNAACTLALKPMQNSGRYGLVEINSEGVVLSFKEKQENSSGNINGGCYILDRNFLAALELPEKFSFEKDFLEKNLHKQKLFGSVSDEYFIDIGIPDDLQKAREDFSNRNFAS